MANYFSSVKARILLGYLAILFITIIATAVLSKQTHKVATEIDGFAGQTLPALRLINRLQDSSRQLVLPADWLAQQSLLAADLQLEQKALKKIAFVLDCPGLTDAGPG